MLLGLNTLTVGQPLVGPSNKWERIAGEGSQYPHSRAASCRESLSISAARRSKSQYPHSRAASCRSSRCPARVCYRDVSIPSQSGSLLSGLPEDYRQSPDPVSIPSQSGSLLSVCSLVVRKVQWRRLNTLTVGQPLVGRCRSHLRLGQPGLNTLTVGQPLVGCPTSTPKPSATPVSIPSQSGSLLSGGSQKPACHRG